MGRFPLTPVVYLSVHWVEVVSVMESVNWWEIVVSVMESVNWWEIAVSVYNNYCIVASVPHIMAII